MSKHKYFTNEGVKIFVDKGKISPHFFGPYKILRLISKVSY